MSRWTPFSPCSPGFRFPENFWGALGVLGVNGGGVADWLGSLFPYRHAVSAYVEQGSVGERDAYEPSSGEVGHLFGLFYIVEDICGAYVPVARFHVGGPGCG